MNNWQKPDWFVFEDEMTNTNLMKHEMSVVERQHLIQDVVRWANDCVTNAVGWRNSYRCFREFLLVDKRCNEDIMEDILNQSFKLHGTAIEEFIEWNWKQTLWEKELNKINENTKQNYNPPNSRIIIK